MGDSKLKQAKDAIRKELTPGAKQRAHYAFHYKYNKVKPNIILFESYHGMTISDSPLHMLFELMRSGEAKNYKIYYATRFKEEHSEKARQLGLPITLVDIHSPKYAEVLATAKYIVNNSSLPAYFIRREDQVHLEVWHGTPLKTLGKRMRNGVGSMFNAQHNYLQASLITFPNEFTRDVMMRDYNLWDLYTGKMAMLGYPRNDVFHDEDSAAAIRKRYDLESLEVFAYMPTWRGTSAQNVYVADYIEQVDAIFTQLDKVLRDDQVMYVNFHSFIVDKVSLGDYKHILPFPKDVDGYDFLAAADVLITDYSSVFFDYSVSRKPVILFMYDLDEYLSDRGLYLDVENLPFVKVYSTDELADCLSSRAYLDVDYSDSDYMRQFQKYDAPDNSRKALDLLFGRPDPSIPITDFSHNKDKRWDVLQPELQRTPEDVDTISACVNPEKDVVLLNRANFKEVNSAYLHDHYRDAYTYVFKSDANVATRGEWLASYAFPPVRKRLKEREQQRVFADASIGSVRRDVFIADVGHAADVKPIRVLAESSIVGNKLYVSPLDCDIAVAKLLLISDSTVVWAQDVSENARNANVYVFDLDVVMAQIESKEPVKLDVAFAVEVATDSRLHLAKAICVGAEVHEDDALPSGIGIAQFDSEACLQSRGLAGSPASLWADSGCSFVACADPGTSALQLAVARTGDELKQVKHALFTSLSMHGSTAIIIARVRKGAFDPRMFVLRYRIKVENIARELPTTIHRKGEWIVLESSFEPKSLNLKPITWDIEIAGDWDGRQRSIPILCPAYYPTKLRVTNTCCEAGPMIFYPYCIGEIRQLAFSYRERAFYDGSEYKLKELAAFGTFAVLHPYWNRKRLWLVYEKYCNGAQDNGFAFFKYCMDNLSEDEKKHIYFIINKNSPDYENVVPYADHVIEYMSFKHLLYLMVAKIYIGDHARTHLYGWRAKPNLITGRVGKHKILFLQHGVTALKKDDHLFAKWGSTPMTYYLTTSEAEQDVITKNFGYEPSEAPILGFARWDVLEDTSSREHPTILLMPTWRNWLEDQSREAFLQSEYYKAYADFIQDERLGALLEKNNATLKFFLHSKMAEQLSAFTSATPRIQLIEHGDVALNKLIMECSMLITDYSSVSWDVLYMGKPVVYYQFDQEKYNKALGSYIDLNTELPGPIVYDLDDLLSKVEQVIDRGFELSPEDSQKAGKWMGFHDKNNSARIYHFVLAQGF